MEVAQDVLTVINEADDDEYIMTAAELGLAQAHCFPTKFDCQIHFDAVEHHSSETLPYNSRKISFSIIQGVFLASIVQRQDDPTSATYRCMHNRFSIPNPASALRDLRTPQAIQA